MSDIKLILFGVPPGSILGPVKFTASQSKLYDTAQLHGVDIYLYADNTQLFMSYDLNSVSGKIAVTNEIQEYINNVKARMIMLKLNDLKTEINDQVRCLNNKLFISTFTNQMHIPNLQETS